jgi:Spy/CpxP family protein refolding chaperone
MTNIKAASIKRILTPEAKANMLAGSMSCKGKNLTEEHKAKISAAHRARRTK